MSETERAQNCWEVERRSCGEVYRAYYIVLLRNKKKGRSVVKAASSDAQSMNEYVEQLKSDLGDLTDDQFVEKYSLNSVA